VASDQLGRKQVLAGAIGNVLEWYDFAAYGFLAAIIGKAFFPSDDPVASLLAAYGALAVGYASRPLGSVIFGHIGDRIGRKPALMISVAMMGAATLGIGLLPTHAEIGVAAAAILVLLRAIQGISVAGEYSSSAVLLVEQASLARRGLIGSLIVMACNSGFLLGSAMGALVSTVLGEAQMNAWGWRVPFFVGAAIALYALFLRRGLQESAVIENAEATARLPVLEALRDQWRVILQIVCLVLPTAVTYFVCFVYAASYLTERMHYSTAKALDISTLALVLLVLVSPIAGLASDRAGRRPVMFFATVASVVATWPLWYVFNLGNLGWILFAQLSFAAINGVGWAMTIPIMVELSPARTRCSTAGIGYNLCLALFGGTTPWVATYLVARTSDDFAPAYYIMAVAALAFVATLRMPEMARRPLRT
jgi:MFS transporter, MHS family, proline/betaine transporter